MHNYLWFHYKGLPFLTLLLFSVNLFSSLYSSIIWEITPWWQIFILQHLFTYIHLHIYYFEKYNVFCMNLLNTFLSWKYKCIRLNSILFQMSWPPPVWGIQLSCRVKFDLDLKVKSKLTMAAKVSTSLVFLFGHLPYLQLLARLYLSRGLVFEAEATYRLWSKQSGG